MTAVVGWAALGVMRSPTNPSEGTENSVVLEGVWLGRFFHDVEGQKMAEIVPTQLSTDSSKSFSAQWSRKGPGKSSWCAHHGPSHGLCTLSDCMKSTKCEQETIWPGIQRGLQECLFHKSSPKKISQIMLKNDKSQGWTV